MELHTVTITVETADGEVLDRRGPLAVFPGENHVVMDPMLHVEPGQRLYIEPPGNRPPYLITMDEPEEISCLLLHCVLA